MGVATVGVFWASVGNFLHACMQWNIVSNVNTLIIYSDFQLNNLNYLSNSNYQFATEYELESCM